MATKKKTQKRGGRKPKGKIPDDLKEILQGIKVYRNKAHFSQQGLADSVGISRGQMVKIEQGEAMPTLDEIYALEKEIRAKVPDCFKIIPLPEVSATMLKLSELSRIDQERWRYLTFEIDIHYQAAMKAAKKGETITQSGHRTSQSRKDGTD